MVSAIAFNVVRPAAKAELEVPKFRVEIRDPPTAARKKKARSVDNKSEEAPPGSERERLKSTVVTARGLILDGDGVCEAPLERLGLVDIEEERQGS